MEARQREMWEWRKDNWNWKCATLWLNCHCVAQGASNLEWEEFTVYINRKPWNHYFLIKIASSSKLQLGISWYKDTRTNTPNATGYHAKSSCHHIRLYAQPSSLYPPIRCALLGLYSLSGKTSYRQISRSLEATRLNVIIVVSLCNLTGTSAAALPMCLLNFRAIGKVQTRISRLRDFTRSCSKTSYRLVNRGPDQSL